MVAQAEVDVDVKASTDMLALRSAVAGDNTALVQLERILPV